MAKILYPDFTQNAQRRSSAISQTVLAFCNKAACELEFSPRGTNPLANSWAKSIFLEIGEGCTEVSVTSFMNKYIKENMLPKDSSGQTFLSLWYVIKKANEILYDMHQENLTNPLYLALGRISEGYAQTIQQQTRKLIADILQEEFVDAFPPDSISKLRLTL